MKWNMNVHSKQTANQIQRNKNRRQYGDLTEDFVAVVPLGNIIDRQLRQIIAMRSAKHLLKMSQITHHRHDMILNITKIKANIHARRDVIVLVTSLGKTAEDVSFSAKKLHQPHGGLADVADGAQEVVHVVGARDEDLVFDVVGFGLDFVDGGSEGVDNVVTDED